MRQISRLDKLTSGRYLVTLEDGMSFPLYGKELAVFGIEAEGVLQENAYQEIMLHLLPDRAKRKAMYLLQEMDRTEHQLREKLKAGHYPEEIVEEAVEYVRSYHYIDDIRYAQSYMEYRKESRSVKCLEQELYRKGISREDFAAALEQIELPDEERQIRQWIEKKRFDVETADRKERERFMRFLLRKGYRMEAICRILCES